MADPEPQPQPTPPAPQPQPQPQPEPSGRRTEADLRAELAAERVSKADIQRTLEARATKAEADLAAATAAAEGKVTTEVGKVTEKLTKMQQRVIDAELKAGAAAAGLRDSDLLLHPLLDRTKIVLNDEGEVSGVAEAFEELKTKKPEWFGTAPAPGPTPRPATGGPAPQPQPGPTPPSNVRSLSQDDYRKTKADLMKTLRAAG